MNIRQRGVWLLAGLKKLRAEPQNVFVVLALLFGVAFVILTPPMQSPDESEHFFRAYQLSQFNVQADPVLGGYGGTLPAAVVDKALELKRSVAGKPETKFDKALLGSAWRTALKPANQKPVRFDNTAIYSPVPYLPQAAATGVMRLVHANPLAIMYSARIANLLAWIALLYVAIRLVPVGKWAFAVVALNPMAVFLAASLSSDAMAIGLIAVFVATILRLRTVRRALDKRLLALFAALAIMVCLTKNAYLPVVLLALLVPGSVVRLRYKLAVVGAALLTGLAWNASVLPVAQHIPEYIGIPGHIDTQAQVSNVLDHPLTYTQAMFNATLGRQGSEVVPSYSGVFGWLDAPAPFWVGLLYGAVLLIALLYRDESRRQLAVLSVRVRLMFALVIVASVGALLTSLYVGYTAVGAHRIEGIQGRYFIPLALLVVPLVANRRVMVAMSPRTVRRFIPAAMLVVLTSSLIAVCLRYY